MINCWMLLYCLGTIRKVLLHCRKDSEEGLGLHLSGGLPPVTVTYVKPGGNAEQAGLGVGDTILEVNGLNCKKKVDISQLMALKMLVQQPLAADQDIDVSEISNMIFNCTNSIHLQLINVVNALKCVVHHDWCFVTFRRWHGARSKPSKMTWSQKLQQ